MYSCNVRDVYSFIMREGKLMSDILVLEKEYRFAPQNMVINMRTPLKMSACKIEAAKKVKR